MDSNTTETYINYWVEFKVPNHCRLICEACKIKSKNTINSTYIQIITCKNIIKNCKSRGWRDGVVLMNWQKNWNIMWLWFEIMVRFFEYGQGGIKGWL